MRNKIAGPDDEINEIHLTESTKEKETETEGKPLQKKETGFSLFFKQFRKKVRKLFTFDKKTLAIFTAGICVFVVLTVLLSNIQIGYAVVLNDKTIGFVSEKYSAQQTINNIYSDIENLADNGAVMEIKTDIKPSVAPEMYFKSDGEIEDIIKGTLDFYVDAVSVYIDGKFAFAAKDMNDAEKTVDDFKQSCVGTDGEVLSVSTKERIEFKPEKVIYTKLSNNKEAASILKGTNTEDGVYTVKNGDTLWSIGIENNMPTDYLMELNNLDSEFIDIGQELRVKIPVPLLNVTVVKRISYKEYKPFETEYTYDSSLTKGNKRTVQQGRKGESDITAVVTSVNTQETDRVIESSTLICEPVKEIIAIGTKEKPKTAATGRFGRPVGGGYYSSLFGTRSRGYHTGLDIALSYGSPVYASDGGTVTYAGWSGGYGYMVKINHGNGYETLYAHCSRLAVSKGKKVAKGQVISYVGSTGNSTGPHLHFEIRKNGSYLNPQKYI